MTNREVMQMALEALETRCGTYADERGLDGAITALRAALAEDVPEIGFGNMAQVVDSSIADHIDDANKKVGDNLAPFLPNCNGMPAIEGPLSKSQSTCQESRQVEPVGYCTLEQLVTLKRMVPSDNTIPLYTAPPQRKPLTVEPVPVMWLNGKPLYDIPPPCKPLQWHKAPVKTEWGEDMVEALVEIDKDHTLKLYCEYDQAARVEAMIGARKPLTNQEIMREYAALWPFLQSEDHVLAQDILKFARAIERAHGIRGEE